MTLSEFSQAVRASPLYLLECGDIVVWDAGTQTAYSSIHSHGNAAMNPMVDLRTHVGHSLLWAKHAEVDASSSELLSTLQSQYSFTQIPAENVNYRAYALTRKEF
jgi:hypothetical protein